MEYERIVEIKIKNQPQREGDPLRDDYGLGGGYYGGDIIFDGGGLEPDNSAEKKAQEIRRLELEAIKDRLLAEQADQAEADRLKEIAERAEKERQDALRAQALAISIKDDELRKYKYAQEDEDRIKEENRIIKLMKDTNAAKLGAIDYATKSYEESILLLKAQNELTIAMQKSFIDTIINF